jgi:hypothetical protein
LDIALGSYLNNTVGRLGKGLYFKCSISDERRPGTTALSAFKHWYSCAKFAASAQLLETRRNFRILICAAPASTF